MSTIIVRLAEPRDFKAVQDIQVEGELLTGESPIAIIDMENKINDPRGVFGVAEIDNEIAGFIFGDKLTGRWSTVSYFVVSKKHRGTEVYKLLGEWFVDKVKEMGSKFVVMYADAENEKLVNFYKHFGFVAGGNYIEMIREI
ncbi:MAG: GNAT family N-acetyltransferase [Alphaproteobacteria bacterium]|nr:GNAT family N-acetyltransferase [Alphaproteobacteria bacterium]